MANQDTFLEQMVKHGDARKDMIRRIYLLIAGVVILTLIVILGYQVLILAGPVVLMVVALMIWILWRRVAQEYEYVYTEGNLDIDVVYSRSTRKSLFSLDLRKAILIAPYDSAQAEKIMPGYKFDKKVYATKGAPTDGTYVIIAEYLSKQYLVYFEPDERILAAIKEYTPRNSVILQKDLDKVTPSYWAKKEEVDEDEGI